MSNKNQDLILHLKLDNIIPDGDSRRVRNALTESQYIVRGNPQVVPDEHFGSCFSFDGNDDFIELPPTSIPTGNEITVSFWANGGNNLPHENFIVLAQTANNSRVLNIHLPWTDKIIYFDCGGNPTDRDVDFDRISRSTDKDNSQDAVAYQGQWNHWAFTKDAAKGEMKIYLNGVLWCYEEGKKQPILAAAKVCIANNYQGKIANFRIYKKALSPEEIKMDRDDDLSAIAAFNLAYPLDFNLYEGENKESVIFIENGTQGQELILEITNNSEQPLALPLLSGNVSASNYHFELKFRPETLSPTSLQQIALMTAEGWSMSSPVTQADDTVSLYFLATSNNQVLGTNNTVSLTLQNISGAAAGGARTTRVELLCPAFTYQRENVTNYYREKTLSIISHRGKKNIPLHVSFVESNRILNDGKTPNELILRIVNVLKDKPIPLIPASKGDEASKFIISFDVQEDKEVKDWALGTKSQVNGIEIKGKDFQRNKRHIEEWNIFPKPQGESPTWTITNQNEENVELRPEQGIQLTISNIISSIPSGQTNLYLRYENIPGYWDGTFVCTIEKTPILYKEGNVGIGIGDPGSYKLNVEGGDIRLGGALTIQKNAISEKENNYHIELFSPDTQNVNNYTKIRFHQGNQYWAWFGYHGTAKNSTGEFVFWNLNQGREAKVRSGDLEVKGNVVGEGTVTAKKFVGEGAFVTGMIIMWSGKVENIPTGWVLCNGQNGTPDLRDRFILGTADNSEINQTGGESSHTHSMNNAGKHSHNFGGGGKMALNTGWGSTAIYEAGDHNHTINSAYSLPPYYKMAFIMKT